MSSSGILTCCCLVYSVRFLKLCLSLLLMIIQNSLGIFLSLSDLSEVLKTSTRSVLLAPPPSGALSSLLDSPLPWPSQSAISVSHSASAGPLGLALSCILQPLPTAVRRADSSCLYAYSQFPFLRCHLACPFAMSWSSELQ